MDKPVDARVAQSKNTNSKLNASTLNTFLQKYRARKIKDIPTILWKALIYKIIYSIC